MPSFNRKKGASVGTKNISTHLGSLIKNAHKEGQEDPGTMVLYPMEFITPMNWRCASSKHYVTPYHIYVKNQEMKNEQLQMVTQFLMFDSTSYYHHTLSEHKIVSSSKIYLLLYFIILTSTEINKQTNKQQTSM